MHSPNAARQHLLALEKKGAIRRTPFKSRAIWIPSRRRPHPGPLPVCGVVAPDGLIRWTRTVEAQAAKRQAHTQPSSDS